MTIQEAIGKAIEGEWKNDLTSKPLAKFEVDYLSGVHGRKIGIWFSWGVRTKAGSVVNSSTEIIADGIFIEPYFGESLGKALDKQFENDALARGEYVSFNKWNRRFEWYCSIDHGAEGKTAESFFETL